MSLETDITIIKQMTEAEVEGSIWGPARPPRRTEEPVFKPATPEQISTRQLRQPFTHDEILELYDWYVENCTAGEIPLSYEEWKREILPQEITQRKCLAHESLNEAEEQVFKPATPANIQKRQEEELKRLEPLLKKKIARVTNIIFPRIIDGLKKFGTVEDVSTDESTVVVDGGVRLSMDLLFRGEGVYISTEVKPDDWGAARRYNVEVGGHVWHGYTSRGLVWNIVRLSRKSDTERDMPELHAKSKETRRVTGGVIKNVEDIARKFMEGEVAGRTRNAYIIGDVLYSYATPIAIRKNEIIYAVDKTFSKTTSRIQSSLEGQMVSVEAFKKMLADAGVTNLGYLGEKRYKRIFKAASDQNIQKREEIYPTGPHDDFDEGETMAGDWAIFIDRSHFVDEWELDSEAEAYLKKTLGPEAEYFVVIENGHEVHGHGWVKAGKIVQWG